MRRKGEGKQKKAMEEDISWENVNGTFAKTLKECHRLNGLHKKKAVYSYEFY